MLRKKSANRGLDNVKMNQSAGLVDRLAEVLAAEMHPTAVVTAVTTAVHCGKISTWHPKRGWYIVRFWNGLKDDVQYLD